MNSIIIMGRLTKAPELKKTQSGISVSSFTVAVDRDYKTNCNKTTDFLNVVAWRNTAEFVSSYFTKGDLISILGTLETRKYTDSTGNEKTAYEIKADKVYFCGSKKKETVAEQYQQTEIQETNENIQTISSDDDLPF